MALKLLNVDIIMLHLPLSTIRTFFHCVLPTLGVWQNSILCLSQTKMRSRTNLLMEMCVRFPKVAFLHAVESKFILFSATKGHSKTGGIVEGCKINIFIMTVSRDAITRWIKTELYTWSDDFGPNFTFLGLDTGAVLTTFEAGAVQL